MSADLEARWIDDRVGRDMAQYQWMPTADGVHRRGGSGCQVGENRNDPLDVVSLELLTPHYRPCTICPEISLAKRNTPGRFSDSQTPVLWLYMRL